MIFSYIPVFGEYKLSPVTFTKLHLMFKFKMKGLVHLEGIFVGRVGEDEEAEENRTV